VTITDAPDYAGVTVTLKGRAVGETAWTVLGQKVVDIVNGQAAVAFSNEATKAVNAEIIATASLGTASLDSNQVEITITPDPSQNIAPIPGGWNLRDLGYNDSSVLHNGHASIRIDGPPTPSNPWRECDTFGIIPAKPGDHIVFKIWIKTGHSTIGNDGKPYMGGIMGFDLYGSSGRLWEICPGTTTDYTYDPTWSWQAGYQWVPYNSDHARH